MELALVVVLDFLNFVHFWNRLKYMFEDDFSNSLKMSYTVSVILHVCFGWIDFNLFFFRIIYRRDSLDKGRRDVLKTFFYYFDIIYGNDKTEQNDETWNVSFIVIMGKFQHIFSNIFYFWTYELLTVLRQCLCQTPYFAMIPK